MVNKYKKNIAESKNIAYFSVIITILLRLGLSISTDLTVAFDLDKSFLLKFIAPYLQDPTISLVASIVLTSLIGLYIAHLNEKYALIRRRTSLPYVFAIFLLSCSPSFIYFTSNYLDILFILIAINILYSSFQGIQTAKEGFKIGFILALGSLFCTDLLVYVPIFWIGFFIMRSFHLKALVATLLGICIVYWPVFLYFVYTNNIIGFYAPFNHWQHLTPPAILEKSYIEIFFIALSISSFCIILINTYANEYKDKIQIRANINILNLLAIVSMVAALITSINTQLFTSIALISSSIILAHFFALVDKQWKLYLFYFNIALYLSIYLYFVIQ